MKVKALFLLLFLYITLFLFFCAPSKPLYIGEWKQKPNTNGWANLKHRLYVEFPDYNWVVFTHPNDSLEKLNIHWPDPEYNQKGGTIIISAEFSNSPQNITLKHTDSEKNSATRSISFDKFKLPFRNLKEGKTVFKLEIFDISEYTSLEEFTAYLIENFSKNIKDATWLKEHNLENHDVTEIENKPLIFNDKNFILLRYRIKCLTDKNKPPSNFLVIGFKLSDKIAFAEFFLDEKDYSYSTDKYYQIVNSIQQLSSEQEFYNLTEIYCNDDELRLNVVTTSNYDDAIKIRNRLDNEKENSSAIIDKTKNLKNEILCVHLDDLMPVIKDAVQHLDVNQISNIIKVQSTYYIIQRMK